MGASPTRPLRVPLLKKLGVETIRCLHAIALHLILDFGWDIILIWETRYSKKSRHEICLVCEATSSVTLRHSSTHPGEYLLVSRRGIELANYDSESDSGVWPRTVIVSKFQLSPPQSSPPQSFATSSFIIIRLAKNQRKPGWTVFIYLYLVW